MILNILNNFSFRGPADKKTRKIRAGWFFWGQPDFLSGKFFQPRKVYLEKFIPGKFNLEIFLPEITF